MVLLDVLMIVLLIAGFGIIKLFLNWCDKQVHR